MDILIEITGKPILSLGGFTFMILSVISFFIIASLLSFAMGYILEKLAKKISSTRNGIILLLCYASAITYFLFVILIYWSDLDKTNQAEYSKIYNNIISHPKIDSLSKMEKDILNRCLFPRPRINYPSLWAIQSCIEDEIEQEKRKEKFLKKQQEMNSFKPIQ